MTFDHERLDCYKIAIRFAAAAYELARTLSGMDRHARDQLLRASQSIPLNIAEGNGKRSRSDRSRFLQIARGSAFECAAILDCLVACQSLDKERVMDFKSQLLRIVQMLSKMSA